MILVVQLRRPRLPAPAILLRVVVLLAALAFALSPAAITLAHAAPGDAAAAIVGTENDYERGYSDALAEANAQVNEQATLTRSVDQCWRTGGAWVWPSKVDVTAAYCYRP